MGIVEASEAGYLGQLRSPNSPQCHSEMPGICRHSSLSMQARQPCPPKIWGSARWMS